MNHTQKKKQINQKKDIWTDYSKYRTRDVEEVINDENVNEENQLKIFYTVIRKNNSKYKTEDLDQIINDENIQGKEITVLEIALKNSNDRWDGYERCRIRFDATASESNYDQPISYSIDDSDKNWAYSLGEELDLYIKRTLKGSRKKILDIFVWIDNIFPTLIFCLVMLLVFKLNPLLNIKLGDVTLLQTLFILPLVVLFIIVLYSLYELVEPFKKIGNMLQGQSVFYIGDQKEIYDKRKKLINNVIWIIIVGFMVSLIAGLFIAIIIK